MLKKVRENRTLQRQQQQAWGELHWHNLGWQGDSGLLAQGFHLGIKNSAATQS